MRNIQDQAAGLNPYVDERAGNAFKVIEYVSDSIKQINYLAQNMELIYNLSLTLENFGLINEPSVIATFQQALEIVTEKELSAIAASNTAIIKAGEAAASLADFKGRWYGPLASDPTLDPNGNAVGEGDTYWNTTVKALRTYNGTAWEAGGSGDAVQSVTAGNNITVDNTDPKNPIVSATIGGGIQSVVAGTNVTVDNTDPENPVVESLPGRGIISFAFASGNLTLDVNTEYFNIALGGNVTGFSFVNLPGTARATTLLIKFVQDSTPRTVAWPASFKWAGGTVGAVSTAAGAVDILALTTFDNGTTWQASLAKDWK